MFATDSRGVIRFAAWADRPWLLHGFSTRPTGDFSGRPAAGHVGEAFGAPKAGLATLRQVHSAAAVRADAAWDAEPPAADAVMTDRPGLLVGIRTADCLPALIVDPRRRAVAAVHAGWRGAAGGVAPTAVTGMVEEYGSRPEELECAIGPGIGACCFEVGEDVAERFDDACVDRSGGRPRVDLVAAVRRQLADAGVVRVVTVGECTLCAPGKYYSHRGEGPKAGRMLAVAGLRADAAP